jgi:hypothetical protein
MTPFIGLPMSTRASKRLGERVPGVEVVPTVD